MTDQLKEAIKIIAEYDGYKLWNEKTPTLYTDKNGGALLRMIGDTEFPHYPFFKYHTSADALLEVWRKVRDEYRNTDEWDYDWFLFDDILKFIGDNKLPQACIEMGRIIQTLNDMK